MLQASSASSVEKEPQRDVLLLLWMVLALKLDSKSGKLVMNCQMC